MQGHEQRPPNPNKPDPRDTRARWLMFAIAILLGMVVAQVVKRLM
jgi:hypothetical protein